MHGKIKSTQYARKIKNCTFVDTNNMKGNQLRNKSWRKVNHSGFSEMEYKEPA